MTDDNASPAAAEAARRKARATRRGRVTVLISSLLTLPAAYVLLLFAALTPMLCDSCYGAELERFDASFSVAFRIVGYGLLAVAAALLATWVLVARHAHTRTCHALAYAAPTAVLLIALTFHATLSLPG